MRLPLSRYAYTDIAVIGVMLLAAAILAWLYVSVWLAMVFLGLLSFFIVFFRDPARLVPNEPGVLVSPADGKIVEIQRVNDCPLVPGEALKIGIFLSIFNVHIVRSPSAGTVTTVNYEPGKFYNALKARSSQDNESNSVVLNCQDIPGTRVLVKQIAGVLARRIVCACQLGEQLDRGQAFGMIKFGSRVEVYLPHSKELRLQVSEGQKVKAGSSVLLHYQPANTTPEQSNGSRS